MEPAPVSTAETGGPDQASTDDPVDRTIPASSPALDALATTREQAPAGLAVEPGDPSCTSLQPLTFYSQPAAFGTPRPIARRGEVFRRGERVVGSVLMFDYGAGQVARVRSFLNAHLWGEEGMPTERHPEDVVVVDNTLLVLCFDPNDAAGDWYVDHLRSRHKARVANRCPALYTMQREITDAGAVTLAVRKPIIYRHEKELLNCSFGAVMVGELARELEDWPRAEAAFRRALELDGRGDALTRAGSLFEATYALALAVSMNGRAAESETLFERAVGLAAAENNRRFLGWAQFNLACARAEGGRFDAAAKALEAAIAIDPSHKARARTDKSFSKARAVPAFQRLLN